MTTLEEIINSFEQLEPADRLQWLIEYGNSLPALPEKYHAARDAGKYIVHECQAPVFLKIDVVAQKIAIYADVPREAPVARGFVSLLMAMFDGQPVSAILVDAPADMLAALQIRDLLGVQRQRGLSAIYQKLKAHIPN